MIEKLFQYNKHWAGLQNLSDDGYFDRLNEGQTPEYLWIGCADSRVPAESLLGLKPGQLFVHRNVANQVKVDDSNSMSVLQYAIDVLKVRHIIVCGHSNCGGVAAAYEGGCDSYIERWLSDLRNLSLERTEELNSYDEKTDRLNRLSEMNVEQQVECLKGHSLVKAAWDRGQELAIHGWVFEIHTGLLKDLNISARSN